MSDHNSRRHPATGKTSDAPAQDAKVKVSTKRSAKAVAWEWFKAIAWALAAALLIRQFLFQAFRIPTGSMKDTLLVHDFLFVNKMVYGAKSPDRIVIPMVNKTLIDNIPFFKLPAFAQPKQGDIIVFEYPQDRNQDYIKRCVAAAGDTVLVREGILTVNGEVYESNFADLDGDHSCIPSWRDKSNCPEPHSRRDPMSLRRGRYNRQFGPYVVPADHLFMMGDNRFNSQDSRYWGPLPLDHVRGKAEVIYWSYERTFFIPRFERLLKIIDLDPSQAWLQPTVRILALLGVAYGFWHYRRRQKV